MYQFSQAHGDKLRALLMNSKLPATDRPLVETAVQSYETWLGKLFSVEGNFEQKTTQLVGLLNEYKLYLDLDLIFDSSDNFLYRQKGQLKLDNSVMEEFLPIFIRVVLENELAHLNLNFGPSRCFSNVYFDSNLKSNSPGGGLNIREKDQDFVISRNLFIQTSHLPDFSDAVKKQTNIAYVAIECKTNLDKTMFQEAAATALDLKTSVPSAKYYLLCEWLDMTPLSSSITAIDEVIILRKAKRLSSNIRNSFNTIAGRKQYREFYEAYLRSHPFSADTFSRIARHILNLITDSPEEDVLQRGHF
jgi:Bpu10I restriction endonuclease